MSSSACGPRISTPAPRQGRRHYPGRRRQDPGGYGRQRPQGVPAVRRCAAGAPRAREGRGRRRAVRPEYAYALTADDIKGFEAFVRGGGTVVCFNAACRFAVQQFKLPVKNAVDGLKAEEFFLRGSIVEVNVDATHPVMAGMPEKAAVFVDGSPVFDLLEGFKGRVLAKYAETGSPLLSGYLIGEKYLYGKAAALDVEFDQGTSSCSVSVPSGGPSRSERSGSFSTRRCTENRISPDPEVADAHPPRHHPSPRFRACARMATARGVRRRPGDRPGRLQRPRLRGHGPQSRDAQAAIQKAVDACAAAGGGTVYVPPGEYSTGTIQLRSRVRVLRRGRRDHFLDQGQSRLSEGRPFLRRGPDRITLEGRGTVDGQAGYECRLKGDHQDDFIYPNQVEMEKPASPSSDPSPRTTSPGNSSSSSAAQTSGSAA